MTTRIPHLERLPGCIIAAGSLALVMIVGVVDYLTGIEVSVTALYLLPVALGTWFSGRRTGILLAGASVAVWLGADLLGRTSTGRPFVSIWNAVMLGVEFVTVAWLLGAIKDKTEHLEQTVLQRTERLRNEIAERERAKEYLRKTNSELAATREELQQSLLQLQHAQMRLVETAKMETLGRLAAGIAHEVKNPLMTLSLGTDYLLARPSASADERTLVEDMKEAVQRAGNIINLLLNAARQRPLELVREEINGVIEEALTLVRHQLNKGRVQVVREFQPGLTPVPLDRTRMQHVLTNLFLNALQAMPEGGTLTVRTSAVAAEDGRQRQLVVEVEDTGTGIKPEDLDKLFEPFFTTKPPGQGTGLGLPIVRKIVEMHGGSIDLANRPEGGARATLRFQADPKE
jgi:signal transduction histidine kinase